MINLEPSWIEVGDCITRQLAEHFPKGKQRDSLFVVIEQMAKICAEARKRSDSFDMIGDAETNAEMAEVRIEYARSPWTTSVTR
jgi:hypothetical protein